MSAPSVWFALPLRPVRRRRSAARLAVDHPAVRAAARRAGLPPLSYVALREVEARWP